MTSEGCSPRSGRGNPRPLAMCLRAFLEGSTYRPDPKSRTAGEIAWQIACEEKMLIEALETGKAEWETGVRSGHDERASRDLREAERRHRPAHEGAADDALVRHAGVLRRPAAGSTDGVELSLRHRPSSSRPNHDAFAPNGIDGSADLMDRARMSPR